MELWALFALASCGFALLDGIAQPMFLSRVGVHALPHALIARSALDILTVSALAPVLRRRAGPSLIWLAAITAGLIALSVNQWLPFTAIWLFIVSESASTVFKVLWGTALLERLPDQAQTRLPRIYSGARVGAIVAGLLLARVATIGTTAITAISAGAFVIFAIALTRVRPTQPAGPAATPSPTSFAEPERRFLLALCCATVLLATSRLWMRFDYSASFASLGETPLIAAFGGYMLLANVMVALIQLVATPRLTQGIGLTGTNLLYAVLLAAISAVHRLPIPRLAVAIGMRAMEHELKLAIKTPVSNLMYGAFSPDLRNRARGLVLGLVSPSATIIAAAVVIFASRENKDLITISTLLFLGATWWQNRSYRRAQAAAVAQDIVTPEAE